MENSDKRSSSVISGISQTVGRYLKLLIEDTRLTMAEKLTRLLSAVTICALVLVLLVVALIFISLGFGVILGRELGSMWAFFVIAAFYIVVGVVILLGKRQFIENPIARFISRLLVQAPPQSKETKDDQSTSVSTN